MEEEKKIKIFGGLNYNKELFKDGKLQENYILQYLLTLLKLLNENKIKQKQFEYILSAYSHFIKDSNYRKYFGKYNKKNAKDKIFEFLDLLQCDLFGNDIYSKRTEFIFKIAEIYYIAKLSGILFKVKITWEKKEIYIYNLYCEFVSFINSKLNYWKKVKNKNIENLPLYKYYEDLLKKETDKKQIEDINSKMENLNLIEGIFFNKYINNLQYFLKEIYNNFVYRFKDNDFNQDEDKLLFEDYLQLLSNYDFEVDDRRLINLWNEIFKPMSFNEKNELIQIINKLNGQGQLSRTFELDGNILKIKVKGEDDFIINEINDYDFITLLEDLKRDKEKENYDYYLNKNLKINKYQTKLFVMKNKSYWIQLNISILGSKSIEESMEFVYGNNYKNLKYLKDQEFLSKEIFENIRFFIYDAKIGGNLNKNSLRIYEYDLFTKNSNKSVSLLLFYSFNTITNINEICGNYYINYYNLVKDKNDKIMSSPNIEYRGYYNMYSDNEKDRKCELGESIEIALFGRRIRELTIKEALFILEAGNYIKGRKYFIEKFNNCNSMKIDDIISPFTKGLLSYFGIIFDNLLRFMNGVYKYERYTNNVVNSNNSLNYGVLHPPEFYCRNLTDEELNKMITYIGLIQKDLDLLK